MNPVERSAVEHVSPFIERTESADVVTDVHIMPDTPIAAPRVAEDETVLPGRHRSRADARRRAVIETLVVFITADVILLGFVGWLILGGA